MRTTIWIHKHNHLNTCIRHHHPLKGVGGFPPSKNVSIHSGRGCFGTLELQKGGSTGRPIQSLDPPPYPRLDREFPAFRQGIVECIRPLGTPKEAILKKNICNLEQVDDMSETAQILRLDALTLQWTKRGRLTSLWDHNVCQWKPNLSIDIHLPFCLLNWGGVI